MKIYKPGQGYWTRLLSGLGGGLLVVGAAAWGWNQLQIFTAEYIRYIQVGLVVVILAGLGWLLFSFVAIRPRTCDFLIATEGEMKKVNWPVRREVIGSTWIVICCVLLMATLLFASDVLFSLIFSSIDVIQGGSLLDRLKG